MLEPRKCNKCGLSEPEIAFYIRKVGRNTQCKERHKRQVNKIRSDARSKGLCVTCHEPAATDRIQCARCLNKNLEVYYETKKKVLSHYGSKCECCGESGLPFLNLDHIDRNGAEESRKLFGQDSGGIRLYYYLVRNEFPPGYRVLCFNCNFASYHNDGVCPHKLTESPRPGRFDRL